MPLQNSGSISLLDIATEFGGTIPHSLSEYYKGGGLVPNTPTNVNVPTSGTIALSQFYGASAAVSGNVLNPLGFNGNTYSSSDTSNSTASLTLYTNGTWQVVSTLSGTISGNWWSTAPVTGIGNSYWVRFTLTSTSGTSDSGSNTTFWTLKPATSGSTAWLQLSSNQAITVSATSISISRNRTATYTVQLASDSGGTNIVSTSTITLSAAASPSP
jgi:hypothetical protein